MERIIYFICPEPKNPSGGVRKIYRHVDILNQHGIAARVLHAKRNFRCSWFKNATQISYADDIANHTIRCLVIPEIAGPRLHESITLRPSLLKRLPWLGERLWDVRGIDKIILNQNAYLTFRGYDANVLLRLSPYDDPSVKAIITVSQDSEEQLKKLFTHMPIFRVRNGIDSYMFSATTKQSVIAYMPRRAEHAARYIHQRLSSVGNLQGFRTEAIAGVHETEVATKLAGAKLYLSLTQKEGFGLPAAEAMASGCLVIGFPAGGGKEFFDPEYCMPVVDGDIEALFQTLQMVINRAVIEPQWVESMGQKAAAAIQTRYSLAIEESDVMSAWEQILPMLNR
jgi:hypothetical protein